MLARIGITGHMNLSRDSAPLVAEALRDVLQACNEREVVGISCLAQGSDQIFTRVALECGGAIEVILPAADYRDCGMGWQTFRGLLGHCRCRGSRTRTRDTRHGGLA